MSSGKGRARFSQWPMLRAALSPRRASGRSKSGTLRSFQLDLAWRMTHRDFVICQSHPPNYPCIPGLLTESRNRERARTFTDLFDFQSTVARSEEHTSELQSRQYL